MNAYWDAYKEKEAVAEQGEEITVTAAEVHRRLGTTASHSTVAKYLSRGLATALGKEPGDSDTSDQVKEIFVRAGMQAVEVLQTQYQKFQVEMHKQCMDEIAGAQKREEEAWARAEELEELLTERDLKIESLTKDVEAEKARFEESTLKIESLETMLDGLSQEKTGWIAEMKEALLEANK